jgi:protein-L-isoaspartate(D-aspartate) O-methyltransferase
MSFPVYILILLLSLPFQEDIYKERRNLMVSNQIEARGVSNRKVLQSMRTVQRQLFVPQDQLSHAYEDRPLPIGYGQTISQPYIVAYMTEIIDPQPQYKVLEIGTGSGYQAAVLSALVKQVNSIEIIPELGQEVSERLRRLGYKNILLRTADGYDGWKEDAPFDAIIVTAAAEFIPPPLISQLKDGGKMVIPVGSPFMTQMLMLIEKKEKKIITRSLFPVAFVPFKRKS